MMASSSILQVSKLSKSFGGLRAVSDVALTLEQGETIGIIGPNGSGKTTVFNLITGLIKADSGEARIGREGADLLRMRPWQIFATGVSRTFQNIRLALGQTVLENVMLGRYLAHRTSWSAVLLRPSLVRANAGMMTDEAMEALSFVAPDLAKSPARMIGELSYADRRRVELARAVAASPRIMLIDEPTAGMNARETDEIAQDIRKIAMRGISILVIEHKMKFVSSVAKRIIVLNFGRKIAEGSYEQIRTNPDVLASYLGRKGDHLTARSV